MIAATLIQVCLPMAATAGHSLQQDHRALDFIQSYRYDTRSTAPKTPRFVEYEILLKTLFRLVFGISSQGVFHFSSGWISYLEKASVGRNGWSVFLMLTDRMVRNIAYVPAHYDIDIRSGKADDLPEDLKK